MKKRLRNTLETIAAFLIIGIITFVISLLYRNEERASNVPEVVQQDTVPRFFSQSPEEGLMDALEYYGVHHREIVYSQAVLETSHFKSVGCVKHNNLFGLYDSRNKRYYRFAHWTESVKGYRDWVQYKWKPPNEDYYKFLLRIRYASDPNYIGKLKQIVNKYGKAEQDASPSCDKQAREGS